MTIELLQPRTSVSTVRYKLDLQLSMHSHSDTRMWKQIILLRGEESLLSLENEKVRCARRLLKVLRSFTVRLPSVTHRLKIPPQNNSFRIIQMIGYFPLFTFVANLAKT